MSHSSNAKTTTKVSSLNLYKKKPNSRAAIGSGRSLLVIGRGKGRGLAKKPIIAPKPINLPSVKKESKGFDPSVVIIPVGSKPGWGSNAGPGWGSNVGPSWGSHTGPPKSHVNPAPPVPSRGAARSSHSPSRSPRQRSESETRSRPRSESETAGKTWADEAEVDDDFYDQPPVFHNEARQQEESSTSPPTQGKSRGPSATVSEEREDRPYACKVIPDKRPMERDRERDQDRRALSQAPQPPQSGKHEEDPRSYMKRMAAEKRSRALEEEARREAQQKANARAKLAEVERRMFQKQGPPREEDDQEDLSRRPVRRESDRPSPEPGYHDEQEEEPQDDGGEEYEDLHLPRDDLGRPLPTPAYSPSLPHRSGGFDPVPQFKLMQRPKGGPLSGEKPEQQQQQQFPPRGLHSSLPAPTEPRGPIPEVDPTKKPSLLKNNGTTISQNNKPPDREVIPTSVWKTPTPPQPPPLPLSQAPISPSLLHSPIFASPPTQPSRERGLGDRRREFVGRRIWADELPPDPARTEIARPLPGIQSYLPAYARKPEKTLVKPAEGAEAVHPSSSSTASSSSSSASTAPISPSLISSPSIPPPKIDPQSLENKPKTNELVSTASQLQQGGPPGLPAKPDTPSSLSRRTPTHDSPRKGKGAGFYKYVAKSKSLEEDKLSSTGTEGSGENNTQQRTPRSGRTPRKTPNVSSGSGGTAGPLIYRAVGTKSGHPNWEAGSPVGTNLGAPRVPSTGADGVANFQEDVSALSQSKDSKGGKKPKPEKYPHIDQDQLDLLRQSLLANNVVVIDGQSQPDDDEDLDGFTEVLGKKEKRTKKKEQKELNDKEAARLSREKREKDKKESQEKHQSPPQPSSKEVTTNNIPNNNNRRTVENSGSAQSPKAISSQSSSKRESPQVLHPLGSQDRSSKKIDLSGPRPLINQVDQLENNIEHAKIMSDVTSSEQTEGDLGLASRLTPRKSTLSTPTDDSLTKATRPLIPSSSPLLSSLPPSLATKPLKSTKATLGRSAFSPSSTSSFSSSVHKIREFVPAADRLKKEQAAVALSAQQQGRLLSSNVTRSPIDSRVPVAIVVPHLSLQQQFGVSNYGRESADSVPVSWDTSMLPVTAAQAPTPLTSSAFQPLSNIPYSHLVDPMAPQDSDIDLQEQEQEELQMSVDSQPPQSLSQLGHPHSQHAHSQPIYDLDQYTSGPPTLYYNSQPPYETIFSNQPVDTGGSHEVRYSHAQQQRLALIGNGVRQSVVDYNAPFILQPTQGVQQNIDPHSRFNGGLWKPGDTELRSFPQRQIPQHSSSPHQHPSPPHPFQPMTVNRSRTPARLQQVDSLYSTQTTHDPGIGLHPPFPQGVSSFNPGLSRLPMQSLPIQPHQQQHRQSPVQFAPPPHAPQALRKSPIIPQRSESAPQREVVSKHLDQVGIGMGKGLGSELGQSLSAGNLTSYGVSENPQGSEHYQGRSRSVPLQSFAPTSPLTDSPQNLGVQKPHARNVHTGLSRKESPQPQSQQAPPPSLNRGSRSSYPRPSTQFPVSLAPPPFSNQMSPPIVRPLLPHPPPYRPPGISPRPPPPRGVRLLQSGYPQQQPPRNRRGGPPLVPPALSSAPPHPQPPRVPLPLPLPLPLPEKHTHHPLHPKLSRGMPPSMPSRPTRPPRVNQQRAQDAALSFERDSPKPEPFVKPEPEPPFPQETVLPPEPTLESELPNSLEVEPKEEPHSETKKPIERPPRTSWAPKTPGSRGRGGGFRGSHRNTPGPSRPAASGSRTSSAPNYVYRKKPGVSTSQPVSQDNQSSPFETSDASSQGASLSTISSRLSNLSFDWPFSPSSSSQTITTSGQSS